MAIQNIGAEATIYKGAYGPGSFSVYGNTYLVWNTDWITIGSGLIVTTATFKDRIIDLSVAQGAGYTAMFGMLLDGQDVDIECVDTTQYDQWTLAMNPFQLVSPRDPALGLLLTGNETNYARKREGFRVANFKSFTAFSLGTPGKIL